MIEITPDYVLKLFRRRSSSLPAFKRFGSGGGATVSALRHLPKSFPAWRKYSERGIGIDGS